MDLLLYNNVIKNYPYAIHIQGEGAAAEEAAVKAAYKCRFKPAIQNGRPVAVWVSYQVEFVQIEGQ